MFKMIKDFFKKETEWGFPFKKKATRFSQWFACILIIIGFYELSEWVTTGLTAMCEEIEDRKYSKITKEIMEEETE